MWAGVDSLRVACDAHANRMASMASLTQRERRHGGSWEHFGLPTRSKIVCSTPPGVRAAVYRTKRLLAMANHDQKCNETSNYSQVMQLSS